MAKRTPAARKTLSAANLQTLGADRLSELLMEATAGDSNLKRKLRLELAAEVGTADLALEIDKRLTALAASRTRVSWRKRPELLSDLRTHLRAIVDRLGPGAPDEAVDRLIAWFDLYPGLANRVKDPKGEVSSLFLEAADDLADLAGHVQVSRVVARLGDAIDIRLSDWAGWIGRAARGLPVELALALLTRLTQTQVRPTGKRALVVRRLAERAGDPKVWAWTFTDIEQRRPEVGAEIAVRLADAGQAEAARQALNACRPLATPGVRRGGAATPPEPSPAWDAAEIRVLEAEGRADAAQAARWALFERALDPDPLRAFIARLADFEDVEATDRAMVIAREWPDATRGLAFLMDWPALRDAAMLILARGAEIKALGEPVPLWVARLEARYPNAALALLRARTLGLARLGPVRAEEVRTLSAQAADLALSPGALEGLEPHGAFIDAVESASPRSWFRRGS